MATKQVSEGKQCSLSTALTPPAIGQHWPDKGGTYIGIASDLPGGETGHLVLLDAKHPKRMAWGDAMNWAEELGNDARLPTRVEALLISTNAKSLINPAWHWTYEQDDASYAWGCGFITGSQSLTRESYEGSAVAVRRLNDQSFNPLEGGAA